MAQFQVSANGTYFGTYEADTAQSARDACAADAGYKSEAAMAETLETLSELVAVEAQRYGATYSTESHNFGEITNVFPVEDDWTGYQHHGYCWAPPGQC